MRQPTSTHSERAHSTDRSAPPMVLEQWRASGEASISYLVADPTTGEAAIIDPVDAHVALYRDRLARGALRLVAVIDTHTHADHVSGAPALSRATGAPVVMHHQAPRACVARRVRHGDEIRIGGIVLRVLATPGHTYDSMCLRAGDALFSGDLFTIGARGHADEACGDVDALRDSLLALSGLPATTRVYGARNPPEMLGEAIARALAEAPSGHHAVSRSSLGDGIRMPADPATLDILQANLACHPSAYGTPHRRALDDVPRLSPDELAAALRSEKPPVVIDVRSPDEYFDAPLGRVPGALLVPLEHLGAEVESLRALMAPLVISCRSTACALLGANLLRQAGLGEVSVLAGGVLAWQAMGHPIERDA